MEPGAPRNRSRASVPAVSPETDDEDAVERVRDAFTDAGFGTQTEFSPSENVGEHTGKVFPPARVIGTGNPPRGEDCHRGDAWRRGDAVPM
jgi:hypothetical protein